MSAALGPCDLSGLLVCWGHSEAAARWPTGAWGRQAGRKECGHDSPRPVFRKEHGVGQLVLRFERSKTHKGHSWRQSCPPQTSSMLPQPGRCPVGHRVLGDAQRPRPISSGGLTAPGLFCRMFLPGHHLGNTQREGVSSFYWFPVLGSRIRLWMKK